MAFESFADPGTGHVGRYPQIDRVTAAVPRHLIEGRSIYPETTTMDP
ncbi:MAG: hypothetical protein M3137_02160 [Actinomycetota bacterium]|nr:hypothetical protein [Actinomycetota bacterium]